MFPRAMLAIVGLLPALPVIAVPAEEPLFPFVITYEPRPGITDLSGWLERPAGKHGHVRAQAGRLVTDAGPIRFWGTNLCFEACFPSRSEAERLAARLASFGINCVRMHHMDSHSIWGDSPNKLTIDPKKLDRLDYLIYQLKQHGIYTNLNLHVSRWFGDAEGFPARDARPHYDKGLGNFEPRMIELQKKYARDLLAHVNPYTRQSYCEDPAIAFVEISNEDALYAEWRAGHLDDLPEPYSTTFRKLWNAWLRKKYGDTRALGEAWKTGHWPLGDEMLSDGQFQRPLGEVWHLERDAQTGVTWSLGQDGPEGRPALRLEVTRLGELPWRPQMHQAHLVVRQGTPYTLTCWLRSDQARRIGLNCMMAHEPWERLGFSAQAAVGTDWKRYRFTFVAERDDANARITFTDLKPGTYWLADVSLRPGGIVGLQPDQRLEDDSVPVLRADSMSRTEPARHDFVDFLWDTERDYWWGMYRFLKEELGVRALVSGTQLSYSPVHIQAGLDYIDAHSYWQHPHFPGRPWDPNDWTVHNVALVNAPGGTLAGLAARRVAGKAFTVSEYNHPAPNVYAAEGFPMIAAFGALQDWDAIFSFTYSHSTEFEPQRITGFFDIKSETAKLAHFPACAAMFLRGDVAQARQTLTAPVPRSAEQAKLRQTLTAWRLTAEEFGLPSHASLVHRVAMDLSDAAGPPPQPPSPQPSATPNRFVSDTGQILWDVSEQDGAYFLVDTPRTKLFTGFVRGRVFSMGNVTLKIGPTRLDWATISMTMMEGDGFDQPGRILIAATGWTQNQGAELRDLGSRRVTLGNRWGKEPVLCEGVPAEITLPVPAERLRFWPLDQSGARRDSIPGAPHNGATLLRLGPEHNTVWYEVEIR